ncbi:P-loop NTPase [Bifidobacterium sp. CP2]|uniref:P-loop NTPase n=1 Tax=Bifidobacterium sp. CP2 TaxID=2809025 RepID=UPI001F0A9050|nr:P-loop NTPase [Bifidobacterium sp. CP2]
MRRTPTRIPARSEAPRGAAGPGTSAEASASGKADNLIVFTSPSGGVGTSTLTALIALTLHSRDLRCALLDADLDGGGLGVLLGIEHEPGLTLQDLDAPLGRIEGEALGQELPHWEDMGVLAHTPWRGNAPEWWELEAAAQALGETNDVVLVDAGRGRTLEETPLLAGSRRIVLTELSVLGMVRAKAHIAAIGRHGGDAPLLVGADPQGAPRRSAADALSTADAIAYLDDDVLGPLRCAPALCADLLAGLGIRAVPRRNRRVCEAIAVHITEALGIEPQW